MRHALHHVSKRLNQVRATLGGIISTDIPDKDVGIRHTVSLTYEPSNLLRSGESFQVEAISDNDTIPVEEA
jgi:hypothetical protein